MLKETAERIVYLTEKRIELASKEGHAKESEEVAANYRRSIQLEKHKIEQELEALIEGRPTHEIALE